MARIGRTHEPIPGHSAGTTRSIDEPAPAVMAGGIWGVRREQCWVEDDVSAVIRARNPSRGIHHDWSVDLPLPTVGAQSATISNVNGSYYCLEETMSDAAPVIERPDVPPYRVPSMAEIAAVPPNGLRVASTFSGCGGSCLGFEMAGFRVVFASEFVEAARATYALNHPGVPIDDRDVRVVTPEDVLAKIGMRIGELDVLEGSPPCASFSTAGKREKGWGQEKAYSDTTQRADDLFFEYARLLKGMQPRTFVAENVSGLVKGKAKGYFKLIFRELEAAGYVVESRVLDAQWLGVPQSRQRIIFQGARRDLVERGLRIAWPTPLPYRYSVRDACPWIGQAIHETGGQPQYSMGDITNKPSAGITVGAHGVDSSHWRVTEPVVHDTKGQHARAPVRGPCPAVIAHPDSSRHYSVRSDDGALIDPETGENIDVSRYAIGRELAKLKPGQQSEKYMNLSRSSTDRPCPTVTAQGGNIGAAGVAAPVQRRKFTLLELRRICAFPDDFALTGTYAQRWERLGRAVPPLMMRAVAVCVRDSLLAFDRDNPAHVRNRRRNGRA